jgi:hypothetical protein
MVRFIDRRAFATAGFEPRRAIGESSLGVLMGICWIALSILSLFAAGIASFDASAALSARTLAWPGLAILFNAITQEALARGYIFQVLQSRTTAITALLVTSLLFTLLHARAFDAPGLPVLNVLLAGILFGLAYLATGNLWLPIGLHFSWNFLLGSLLGGRVSGHMLGADRPWLRLEGPSLWTGGEFGLEGSLAVTIVTAIACWALIRLAPLSKGVLCRTPLNPRPRVGSESRRSGSP